MSAKKKKYHLKKKHEYVITNSMFKQFLLDRFHDYAIYVNETPNKLLNSRLDQYHILDAVNIHKQRHTFDEKKHKNNIFRYLINSSNIKTVSNVLEMLSEFTSELFNSKIIQLIMSKPTDKQVYSFIVDNLTFKGLGKNLFPDAKTVMAMEREFAKDEKGVDYEYKLLDFGTGNGKKIKRCVDMAVYNIKLYGTDIEGWVSYKKKKLGFPFKYIKKTG